MDFWADIPVSPEEDADIVSGLIATNEAVPTAGAQRDRARKRLLRVAGGCPECGVGPADECSMDCPSRRRAPRSPITDDWFSKGPPPVHPAQLEIADGRGGATA